MTHSLTLHNVDYGRLMYSVLRRLNFVPVGYRPPSKKRDRDVRRWKTVRELEEDGEWRILWDAPVEVGTGDHK